MRVFVMQTRPAIMPRVKCEKCGSVAAEQPLVGHCGWNEISREDLNETFGYEQMCDHLVAACVQNVEPAT